MAMSTLETDKLFATDMFCHESSRTPIESPKRIAIVEAATRLFLDSGYQAVSMDAIADAANVSKRTVYSHFSSKETLFGAVMQMMCRRFNRMDSQDGPLIGPPEEALVALGTDFLTLITSPEAVALYRVVTAEAPRYPKLAEVFAQNGPDPFCVLLSSYFEDQTRLGTLEIDQPTVAAQQFWELIKAPFHMKLLLGLAERPDTAAISASVKATVANFLRMYRPAS